MVRAAVSASQASLGLSSGPVLRMFAGRSQTRGRDAGGTCAEHVCKVASGGRVGAGGGGGGGCIQTSDRRQMCGRVRAWGSRGALGPRTCRLAFLHVLLQCTLAMSARLGGY